MEELHIDWNQEKPDRNQIIEIWKSIRFEVCNEWSEGANALKEIIEEAYCNGGVQLHKYKIIGNNTFKWFAERNRLEEIKILKNTIKHPDLQNYRDDLKIRISKPKIKNVEYWTDIYDLPGRLARIMRQGGPYRKIEQGTAWQVAVNFVESEFQNRFEEVLLFYIVIEDAEWFFDIAWDYSIILFDKRNYEIIFIDMTDTD